jgi:hypothetical protein
MRAICVFCLVAFVGSVQAWEPIARTIDLRESGALEALSKDNPEHYRKVLEIIQVAEKVSCESLPQVLHTKFNVYDATCRPQLLLTSFPPKRRLAFRLDDSWFVVNVTLRDWDGTLDPAR